MLSEQRLTSLWEPGKFTTQLYECVPESLTSTMQLFTSDYIAQDVSVGFTRFLPAELQGIRAQSGEDQGARGTGSAQSKW